MCHLKKDDQPQPRCVLADYPSSPIIKWRNGKINVDSLRNSPICFLAKPEIRSAIPTMVF